jgi:pimeloyl-ACP methyl ester carboxylesterase
MRRSSPVNNYLKTIARRMLWVVLFLTLFIVGCVAGYRLRLNVVEKYTVQETAPVNGRWVFAHDVKVYLQEFGPVQGKPVVMVHGTGAWSGTWGSNVSALVEAGFRVIAIDLPPFGYSERVQRLDYSRHSQAKRVLAVIDSLDVDSVTLLGHSFGGGPAAEAAMIDSKHIAHLVLIDAAIGLKSEVIQNCEPATVPINIFDWRPLRTALLSALATNPLLSEFWLRQFVARKEVVTPERTAIYQAPFNTREFTASLGDWAWQFAAGCEESKSTKHSEFKNLRVPVSLVWGDQDTITPIDQGQRLHKLIERSRLTVLNGVGHIPQIEDIKLFNTRIVEVLKTSP